MEMARVLIIFDPGGEAAEGIVVFIVLAAIAIPICLALDWLRRRNR